MTTRCRFILPALLLLSLTSGCGDLGPAPTPDPNNSTFAASLGLEQPLDACGNWVVYPMGQPAPFTVSMTQTGPGTCTDTWAGSSCSGPGIPLAFQLTSITCDDDLCDVAQIETGDAKSGDIVTIVPKACSVTVHVVATTGSLTEAASLVVATTCAPGAADTSCFPP